MSKSAIFFMASPVVSLPYAFRFYADCSVAGYPPSHTSKTFDVGYLNKKDEI